MDNTEELIKEAQQTLDEIYTAAEEIHGCIADLQEILNKLENKMQIDKKKKPVS